MSDTDNIKALETRVTNLESAVGQILGGAATRAALYSLPIHADPASWPWIFGGGGVRGGGGGGIPDPAPTDFSRLSSSQLESSLHSINSEKARLASLEAQVTQQMDRLKKKG